MIPAEEAAWRRALGEASCLPPEDAERLAVEAEVARRGGLVEREWFALLSEAERWRIELRRVEPPSDLEQRLLSLPTRVRPRTWGTRRRALMLGGAATLAVALVWLVARPTSDRPQEALPERLQALALLAMNDHAGTHALEVTTDDPTVLAQGLADSLPFAIRLPALAGGATLLGGRRCTLGSHPVCFSAWRVEGFRVTLIQLRSRDFGLPDGLTPVVVTPSGAAAAAGPLDVLLWSTGEAAYALVADDPTILRRVAPAFR